MQVTFGPDGQLIVNEAMLTVQAQPEEVIPPQRCQRAADAQFAELRGQPVAQRTLDAGGDGELLCGARQATTVRVPGSTRKSMSISTLAERKLVSYS